MLLGDDRFFTENYVYIGKGGELNCHVSHFVGGGCELGKVCS